MYISQRFISEDFTGVNLTPKQASYVKAEGFILCNPNITTKDNLISALKFFVSIPEDKLETITLPELEKMGWGFGFFE